MITENNYQKQWSYLTKSFKEGNLAHAFLFSGQNVDLINKFANKFIKFANCLEDNKLCDKCQNCQMIERKSFADFKVIRSQDSESSQKNKKDMGEIVVEQIRDVQKFLDVKSYYGKLKAVIIESAEKMNSEAANCLLKILEEPKGNTLIILISKNPDFLLSTVTSRCQQIKFETIKVAEEGYQSELISLVNSDLAEKFKYTKNANLDNGNFENILKSLQKYFRDLMLLEIGVISKSPKMVKKYSLKELSKIILLTENLIFQNKITNLNKKLALENLLLEI